MIEQLNRQEKILGKIHHPIVRKTIYFKQKERNKISVFKSSQYFITEESCSIWIDGIRKCHSI